MQKNPHIIEKAPGVWIVKKALSADICQLVSEYVRFKAHIQPRVSQSTAVLKQVHREYADPLMETLLAQMTPLVAHVLGKPVWPTLSFCYLYTRGNQLLKHTDRSSCQWVAGVCLGADEAFKASHAAWPLQLSIHGKTETCELDYGDMLIFSGHTTEHWRDEFAGAWFVSAIYGFVEQSGPYAFQKFDQRRALGLPYSV